MRGQSPTSNRLAGDTGPIVKLLSSREKRERLAAAGARRGAFRLRGTKNRDAFVGGKDHSLLSTIDGRRVGLVPEIRLPFVRLPKTVSWELFVEGAGHPKGVGKRQIGVGVSPRAGREEDD
jgi:hypothetical protein